MTGRPPLRSVPPHDSDHPSDPLVDRPRSLQFREPQPNPSDPTLSLSREHGSQGHLYDEEEVGKQSLTDGNVAGGFYPPG